MNTNILKKASYYTQGGFTLLELMIALVLGLVISAAALQLFLVSQKNITTQQALLNLQSDSLFGLEALARDVRLANLNASQPYVDDSVLHGGIVLDGKNYTTKRKAAPNAAQADISLTNALSVGVIGDSNLKDQKSDVLVIQYQNILNSQFDCEGNQLAKDVYVVERYFLREDTNRNDPNQPLALACMSVIYSGDEPTEIKFDSANKGQVIIPRVDHFSVMLGVAQDGRNTACTADDAAKKDGKMDCFGYISIENYKKLTVKPQILAIKVGLLIRSTDTVGQNQFFDPETSYQVLSTNAKLIANDRNKLYMRNVVTQTIALRNGFGIEK